MKQIFTKAISSILALIMLVSAFALISCKNENKNEDETTESTSKPNSYIKVNDLSKYYIVRSDNASKKIFESVKKLNKAIEEKLSIKTGGLRTDFILDGNDLYKVNELEIIVGNTNREESLSYYDELKYGEFGYAVYGKKIVISGTNDQSVDLAVDAFIDEVINKVDGENLIGDNVHYISNKEYKYDNIKLNGSNISDYYFSYTTSKSMHEDELVNELIDFIGTASGEKIKVVNTPVEGHTKYLVVGNSPAIVSKAMRDRKDDLCKNDPKSVDKYFILIDKDLIWISGNNLATTIDAINHLKNAINSTNGKAELKDGVYDADNPQIKVMSYNVYVGNSPTYGGPAERRSLVAKVIEKYSPDVIGMQEASNEWMSYLRKDLGDIYGCIGLGRESANNKVTQRFSAGEHCPIFYNKEKFKLIESNTYWLTDTPNQYSKVNGSDYPRIMTYAILERKSDGYRFMHVNTHIDYVGEKHGETDSPRTKQIKYLLELIDKIGFDGEIFVTGDFNCGIKTDSFKVMLDAGYFDSFDIANTSNIPDASEQIDFCFFNSDKCMVESHKVIKETVNGKDPSDHYAVLAVYVPRKK